LVRSLAVERLEGFRTAMGEAGLPIPGPYLQRGDFRIESGYRAGTELMHLPIPPTAIFVCNNRMTLGLMRALSDLKVPCPGRVSVIGFDEVDWATICCPSLTCVAHPSYDLGRRGAELLIHRIEHAGKESSHQHQKGIISLETELHIRESCAPPPSELQPDRESRREPVQETEPSL